MIGKGKRFSSRTTKLFCFNGAKHFKKFTYVIYALVWMEETNLKEEGFGRDGVLAWPFSRPILSAKYQSKVIKNLHLFYNRLLQSISFFLRTFRWNNIKLNNIFVDVQFSSRESKAFSVWRANDFTTWHDCKLKYKFTFCAWKVWNVEELFLL